MLKKTTSQQDYETTSFFKSRNDSEAFDSNAVV